MSRKARLRCRQVLAAVVIGFTVTAAQADNARIVYYDVTGSSAAALRRQLNANGPLGEGGKRFDAHAEWQVSWRYRYRPTASGCRFTEMKVSVGGTIVLPRWVDAGDAPQTLVRTWRRYIAALRVHEEGHYAHGVDAAREMEALGRSFHATGDCSTFVADFNAAADAIIDKYKAMDAMYDRETDHGKRQGATFP